MHPQRRVSAHDKDAMQERKPPKLTRQERLRRKLSNAQEDSAAGVVTLEIRLTGVLADVWRSLQSAADGLRLSDSDLLGMLLSAAVRSVRLNLRSLQREPQP